MTKVFRHAQILKLIRSRSIYTQDELARLLRDEGIEAGQVTLSRDMRELNIIKAQSGYQELEPEEAGPRFAMLAGEFVQNVKIAQNLVVLKTSPGHANSVAIALDQEEWSEVVGTVAGDDTILVICPDAAEAARVRSRLLELLST